MNKSKKRKTSEVWEHFSLSTSGTTIKCKLFPDKTLKYKGNTSVMWSDMKAIHGSVATVSLVRMIPSSLTGIDSIGSMLIKLWILCVVLWRSCGD